MKTLLLLTFLAFSPSLLASDSTSDADLGEACSAFPENSLRFGRSAKNLSHNRAEFDRNLKTFQEIMFPKIQLLYNKELRVLGVWEDDRVNASASRDSRENPVITVAGGLFRHPKMDRDALYLILCHELGHQFGGAPKQFRGRTTMRSWSSAEGQADYYAASQCMPYLYEQLKLKEGNLMRPKVVSSDVLTVCDTENCRLFADAAHKVAQVFYDVKPIGRAPDLKVIDQTVAYKTQYSHPSPQCRLDTFLSAAHCDLEEGRLFDDIDAFVVACGPIYKARKDGSRPSCWFNPQDY